MMQFEKVTNKDGRIFIKTRLQDELLDPSFDHNFEMLHIEGVTQSTIEDIIYGTMNQLIAADENAEDKSSVAIVNKNTQEAMTYVMKTFLDNSCILINRVILPDSLGRFPWEDDCDARYKLQWIESDETNNKFITEEFNLDPTKKIIEVEESI